MRSMLLLWLRVYMGLGVLEGRKALGAFYA